MSEDPNTTNEYENQAIQSIGEKLYLDDETADVFFAVKSNDDDVVERIPAHKCQLAAISNVFKAMFYGKMKELGDVKITDIHVSAFKEFLQFFYLSRVQLTMENLCEVMNFGHKYNVSECLNVCLRFLKDSSISEDVCNIYHAAIVLDLSEFKQICENFITLNTENVFKSDGFMKCTSKVLCHILKINLLSCSEMDVFKACVSWVKALSKQNEITKESLQAYLGDLFYEIRFRSMSIEQFTELIPSFGHLFSINDIQEIIQMIQSKDFKPKFFNEKFRKAEWDEVKIVECDRLADEEVEEYFYMNPIESITFSTNEPVLLGEFDCQALKVYRDEAHHDLRSDLPTEITITENSHSCGSSRILSQLKANLGSKNKTVVTLTEPVLIRPGFKYTIELKQSVEGHCLKGLYMEEIVNMDFDITINFHSCNISKDTKNIVSPISVLKFNRI
ncbi:BTB/POZ domain-containing protein 3-like [Contarinia nasturtii]|uniref:BTB/POZ domain-containing protein 3-like n=1 Tax=Contarinia nasturtii TaxID=265458 RepID=UPI0012D3E758|nr:BTB/POZ domain-containing protein 3-like [Contarinia nasturtii]